jgi:hypothetical protein
VKRPAPDDRGVPRATHRARRAARTDAPTAQARASPLSPPSSTRSTPSCTTPRPTSNLPENLEGFLARLADTADTVGHQRAANTSSTSSEMSGRSTAARPATPATPLALGSFQIAARFGLARSSLKQPTHLRFIDSSMVSVSPDVDREGRLGQMPAFDRRWRAPLRGRVATRARRVDATLSASAGVATARASGRGRGVSIARPLAGPASPGKQPDPKSCSLHRPRIPSALVDAQQNATRPWTLLLVSASDATAVSRHQIEPLHAARLERQESRRPTRQWLRVRPGDAALWRRRRAVSGSTVS